MYPVPFLIIAMVFSASLSTRAEEDPVTASARYTGQSWSLSPVFGFISGGFVIDSPGSNKLIYGIKLSHYTSGSTRVDIGVTRYESHNDSFLINGRANYQILRYRWFFPYLSTGAGLIAADSGGAFDFLFGSGFIFRITDRFAAEQAYLVHYSPSQALTDAEGNPFNSFESSLHFWF